MKEVSKICVLGLGYIGLPTSVMLTLAGYDVHGVDVNPRVVEKLSSGDMHIIEPGLQEEFDRAKNSGRLTFSTEPVPADAFILAVPTPSTNDGGFPHAELKYVRSAAQMVGKVLKEGNTVILESTSPPGTTAMMHKILAETSGLDEKSFYSVHCPERVMPGSILRELRENDRVVGSVDEEGRRIAESIYKKVVTTGKIHLTDDKTAEFEKIAENAFRDVNIAFANELSILADKAGVDVYEVIRLANCHPRVNILTPGVGVGGHCIPLDPWFLAEVSPDDAKLLRTARYRNDEKPMLVAKKVKALAGTTSGKTVAILGLAYKPDADDTRESPSFTLADALKDDGFNVVGCEPNVEEAEVRGIPNLSLEKCAETADILVVAQKHSVFVENKTLISSKPYVDCVGLMR